MGERWIRHRDAWIRVDEGQADWDKKNDLSMAILSESLDDDLALTHIEQRMNDSAYAIVKDIVDQYIRVDNVSQAMLNNEYDTLNMNGKTFEEYCKELVIIANKLKVVDIELTDKQKIAKMMNVLFKSRYNIWNQVQGFIMPDTQTFEQVKNIVQSYVVLNETRTTKNVDQKGKKRKIMSVTIDGNGKKYTKDLSNIKCYNCGNMYIV